MLPTNPAKRTELALKALGWQGGTVHQICQEFGVEAHEFLYHPQYSYYEYEQIYQIGWFGIRTCTRKYFLENLLPRHKGNLLFVFGVLSGLNVD